MSIERYVSAAAMRAPLAGRPVGPHASGPHASGAVASGPHASGGGRASFGAAPHESLAAVRCGPFSQLITHADPNASPCRHYAESAVGALVRSYPAGFFPWSPGLGMGDGTPVIKAIATDANGLHIGAEGTGGGVFDGRVAFDWGTYDQRWRDTRLGATKAVPPYHGVLYASDHAHDGTSEGT